MTTPRRSSTTMSETYSEKDSRSIPSRASSATLVSLPTGSEFSKEISTSSRSLSPVFALPIWVRRSYAARVFVSLRVVTQKAIKNALVWRRLSILRSLVASHVERCGSLEYSNSCGFLEQAEAGRDACRLSPTSTPLSNRMVDDILTVFMSSEYSAAAHESAGRMMLDLINVCNKAQFRLVHRVWDLPAIELDLFLSMFMATSCTVGRITTKVSSVLRDGCGLLSYHILLFLCRLVLRDAFAYEQLIDDGFLDFILSVCLGPTDAAMLSAYPSMIAFCSGTIRELCNSRPAFAGMVSAHALSTLWPSEVPLCVRVPQIAGPKPSLSRPCVWRRVGAGVLKRRLAAIEFELSRGESDSEPIFEVAFLDLIEFSRPGAGYDSAITETALQLIRQYVENIPERKAAYDFCLETIEEERRFSLKLELIP